MANTNLLTASEAHEIATKWQKNQCADYVESTLTIIKKRASSGYFSAEIRDCYPDNVDRDACRQAVKDLGYQLESIRGEYTRWSW
jgi:hypothetical protein